MKLRYAFLLTATLATAVFATATHAGGPLTIFDMDYVFQCTTLKQGSPKEKPEYVDFPGVYAASQNVRTKVCEFVGAAGEHWHPLFPSHTAYKDESCKIAYENQKNGNTISRFQVPPSCLEYNEVANLMSANAPASASPELGQSISFATRIEMIRRAKKSIRIQYLIVFGDESGWAIAEELKKKKAENPKIDIRLNVDALSNFANETNQLARTQAMYFDLLQHGISVNGAFFKWVLMNEVRLSNPLLIDKRWHDKIFVVDAEDPDNSYAIAGGQNIGNEYFRVGIMASGDPVYGHKIWRDQDVLLHGPIVRDMAKAFDNNFEHFQKIAEQKMNANLTSATEWVASKLPNHGERAKTLGKMAQTLRWDELLGFIGQVDPDNLGALTKTQRKLVESVQSNCPTFFLGVNCQALRAKGARNGSDGLYIQFYPYSNTYAGDDAINKDKDASGAKMPWYGRPYMNEETGKHIGRIYAELAKGSLIDKLQQQHRFYPANMRWFNNHPRYGETYIMQAYADAINRSKREIIISNAYFVPNRDEKAGLGALFMDALKDAVVNRGVDLTIMTNDVQDCDGPDLTWDGRQHYGELLAWNDIAKAGGPRHKKGSVAIHEWNADDKMGHKENTNHAKYAIFDAKEVIVGSFNLDHRSAYLNSETVVAIQSAGFASEMERQFTQNDLPKSVLITKDTVAGWAEDFKKPRHVADKLIEVEM